MLEQKMSQLLECLDAVRYKILFYQAAQKAGTISIHENIPAKVKEVRRRMMHPKR